MIKEIQICPAHLVIFKLKMVAYFKCFCVNFFNRQISESFMKIIKIHARTFHFHCIYLISFSKAFRFGHRRSDWFACNFQPASVPPLSSSLWLTCFGGSSRGSIHLGVRYKQALKSSVVLISWSCSYVWCDCVMFIFQWVHAVSGHSANHLTLVLLPRAML